MLHWINLIDKECTTGEEGFWMKYRTNENGNVLYHWHICLYISGKQSRSSIQMLPKEMVWKPE